MALGQTPAQAAGIGIQGENKWLMMLREAIKGSQSTVEVN